MWKTHAFRRALGPLLKQLDAEYDIPAEQQRNGPDPVDDDGSPFRFLPPVPVVLFCKNSPSLKKTDDTSSGEVEEVPMPSATLDLATSASVADKVANLADPTAETQEPITFSSVVPLVSGEGYDLSSLLTFDPESIEPATAKASEEPGPSAIHGQLQHLKALLSSSIETLVEDSEAVKGVRKTSASSPGDLTAELATLRKELEALEEKVRATKQLIEAKEALIAHSLEEAEGLKAELNTDLAEIRALNKQLVAGKDEDDEAEIAEVDRVRADALHALEMFLQ
ncbi:hypothetical protein QYE76_035930 [Lolium multiflorum]|uniref:Uncharacterized protein n=1 Tax=Lolium multiflorum TaxID=4521 RepID=A0AAD8VLM5_LOLMU|nr:hypothetical protein QYE76_035930 [Lolium multiflorum]